MIRSAGMESISLGGRPIAGFALADQIGVGADSASPKYAALMTGAAAGLFVYVLKAPVWGAIVVGSLAAITTKYAIDQAA